MASPHSSPDPIDELLTEIKEKLCQTWQTTGFGHLAIDSERINQSKIRVILRSSTHYRYVISDEDITRWREH